MKKYYVYVWLERCEKCRKTSTGRTHRMSENGKDAIRESNRRRKNK